jgi:hypothetical protein
MTTTLTRLDADTVIHAIEQGDLDVDMHRITHAITERFKTPEYRKVESMIRRARIAATFDLRKRA